MRPRRRLRARECNRMDSCPPPRSFANGGHDSLVGAATADVAAHPLADLIVAAGVPFMDDRDGGTDLSRRAVAALKAVVADERRLHGVEPLVRGDPFDRRDLPPAVHDREGEAGV